MKYRSTLIYFVLAVLVVAFYFYETRKEEKRKSAEEESRTLFSVKADDVTSFALKSGDQEVRFEKKSGTWEILHPVRSKADPFALTRLLNRLTGLKVLRLVSENPKDLSEFGLREPEVTLAFRAGEQENTLSIGYISPIEKGYYVSKGGDRKVYFISGDDKRALDRPLLELRDKKLFDLKTDLVQRVVIERKGARWDLHKKEEKWSLEGHEDLKLDPEKVEVFVRPTVWAEAMSFEKEEVTDLKPYGLDAPQARVGLSDGTQSEEIIYGKDAAPDRVFALVKGKPQLVTVRKRLLDDLPKTTEELVEKEKKEETKS
ncbi:MAG: DUF4340 domain-containing protein [Deltaproteobacteria bacterium]